MTSSAAALTIAAAWLLAAHEGHAQQTDTTHLSTGRIMGRVLDAGTKNPIQGASVRISDFDGFVSLTDSRGSFIILNIPRGIRELIIEHIGYGVGAHLVHVPGGETVTIEAALETHAIQLDSLVITAHVSATQLQRAGFHYRARRGFGHFFSAGEVTTATLREALQSVPRLEFVQAGTGSARQVNFTGPRGGCVPEIFIDGVRQNWANGEIEFLVGGLHIEAMEVYRGMNTPGEFQYRPAYAPCGAIVLWTRR